MRKYIFIASLLGCLQHTLLHSGLALGQSVYGGIHGTVRDVSHKPVPKATVTLTSEEKGTRRQLTTNQRGHYEFSELLPETYDLTVEEGDRKLTVSDISVVSDSEALVDPVLGQRPPPPGGSTLKTRADVSITLDANALQNLPNFTRNFTLFELLAPGTELNNATPNFSRDPQQSLIIAINGQRFIGTAFQLDGTDNRDPLGGPNITVINPTLESLSEMKITTQSYDAESGQALSGIITVQTRSGSNTWHGSVFDFRRSNWGGASNPELINPSLATTAPFKVNIFDGAVGGPIVKNKIFIFGDYQGNRSSFGATQVVSVPTHIVRDTCLNPASMFCDLSEYLPINQNNPGLSPLIYDPQTNKPFPAIPGCGQRKAQDQPGYCIPTSPTSPISHISPQAVNLLSLLPPPNLVDVVSNYQVNGAAAYDDDEFNIRVDDTFSQKMKLFGRYSFDTSQVISPSAFGPLFGGIGFSPDGFAGHSRATNQSLSTGFDYSFGSSLLTDFRFGFLRRDLSVLANSYNTTPATNAGIMGLNLASNVLSSGMPAITIAGPSGIGIGIGAATSILFGDGQTLNQCNCPLFDDRQQFQLVNNWAQTRGKHVFKWGADFRYLQDLHIFSPNGFSGTLGFLQEETSKNGNDSQSGLGLATFLLGIVSSAARAVGDLNTIENAGQHEKRLFFYGQDTWRVTPQVTLTFGLRWEAYFPRSVDGKNEGGWLDLNTGMINVAGYPCCNLQGNVHSSLRAFAPRVGIAYQTFPKTVLRAAYGRNFAGSSLQIFGFTATQNPPVLLQQVLGLHPKPGPLGPPFPFGPNPPSMNVPPNVPPSGQFPLNDPNADGKNGVQVTAIAVPNKISVPTLDQWNLTLQQELASNLYLEIGYVGNKATHNAPLGASYDVNQPTIAGFAANNCSSSANAMSNACLNRFPFFQRYGWTQPINYVGDNFSENYNALQAKLVKRFNKGYQFTAAYTWSKGLGFDSNYYVHDPRLDYAPNNFDRSHTFVFYDVLALPIGRGKALFGNAGKANYLIGGWSVNTISTWASGFPFSPTYLSAECIADRDTGPCRPNLVGVVHINGDRNNYFTTASGPLSNLETSGPWQRPAVGTFGTARRNSLRGPSYFDTDLAVVKNITISEAYTIQFRTDFLNVFNRVNLGNPNGCVDCFTDNLATGAVIQTLAPNASQRQIKFALRFQF